MPTNFKSTITREDGAKLEVDWTLHLTAGSMKKLKAKGFNIYELADDDCKGLRDLENDDEKISWVLWNLCEEQAAKVSCDQNQFDNSLDGSSFWAAWSALLEAFINFIRDEKILSHLISMKGTAKVRADLLVRIEQKMERVEQRARTKMESELEKLTDKKIEELMEKEIVRMEAT